MPQASDPPRLDTEFDAERVAAEVATRYLFLLRAFAAKRLRDRVLADDAAQETLRRVLEALRQGRIRDLQALPSFTFETASHVCQDLLREQRRRGKFSDATADPAELTDPSADPLACLVSAERADAVRQVLDVLDPSDRELVRLTFVEGDSSEAIAQRLGLSTVNVRVRRHRILRRLQALLAERSGSHRGGGGQ